MYNPPSPGEFIREICLMPLDLTVTQAAKAFNTTPESWLTQQMHYNLWQAKQKIKQLRVKKLWLKTMRTAA